MYPKHTAETGKSCPD